MQLKSLIHYPKDYDSDSIKKWPLILHGMGERGENIESIKKIGGNVKFTLYPNVDHDSWTKIYNNKKNYDWLLTHSQKN